MNRNEAYKYLGCASQYYKNKNLADRILDVLENCTNPKGMTTDEIVCALNATLVGDGYYHSQVERILKELWGHGYGWRPSFINKTLIADEKPTIIDARCPHDEVRVDNNGNYVFKDKMVVDSKVIKGDFSSYFRTLGANSLPRVHAWLVEVPMEIYVKRNYWSIKGE